MNARRVQIAMIEQMEQREEVLREEVFLKEALTFVRQEQGTQRQSQQEQCVGWLELTAKLDSFMLCH